MLATRKVMSVFTTRMMVTVRVTRTKMLFLIVFLNLIHCTLQNLQFFESLSFHV